MVTIPISGIIANFELESESNVTPSSLRKSLEKANGEDILVTINSPGGGVFAGLEMFSLLKNYSGNVETRIVSLAASMGSVLALAGNKKSAEDTALYFIHNAQGIGIGDYRELAKESKWLKDISTLIAELYAKYTSLSIEDATELMDADSQFFGKDLELLGFDIVETGEQVSEAQAKVNARLKFSEVQEKVKNEKYSDDLEQVAASIDYEKFGLKKPNLQKDINDFMKQAHNPAEKTRAENKPEVITMTLKEFLDSNPAAMQEYQAALAAEKDAGMKKGKDDYIASLEPVTNYLNSEEYPKQIKDVAIGVIMGKKSLETLDTMVASVDMFKELNKSAAAALETQNQGATPNSQEPQLSENGEIKSVDDFTAEVARLKAQSGVEVN